MVTDALHFTLGGFAGPDIETAVDLARIGGDHLAIECLGEFDGEPGLTRSSRPDDDKYLLLF